MNVNVISNSQQSNVQQYLKLQNNAISVGSGGSGCGALGGVAGLGGGLGSSGISGPNTTASNSRFTVSLNSNVANISNVLMRSPMKMNGGGCGGSNSGLQQQSTASRNTLGLGGGNLNTNLNLNLNAAAAAEYRNSLSATLANLNSYSINLQNQLNFAKQQQAAAVAAAAAANSIGPSLLTAASVINTANSLAASINMYQPMQSQQQATCNLNNTLFVGNLHASLQEIDLIQVFRPFGRIVECCKKWLHFGFVKFTSEEEACHAYVTLNGFRLKGRPMRLEFQNRTKKARIKAILAQAALQASNGHSNGGDFLSTMGCSVSSSLGFHMDERGGGQHSSSHSYFQQQLNAASGSAKSASAASVTSGVSSFLNKLESSSSNINTNNSFFNADHLIKFANGSADKQATSAAAAGSSGVTLDDEFGLGSISDSNFLFDLNDADLAISSSSTSATSSSSASATSSTSSLSSIKQYASINTATFEFKLNDDLINNLNADKDAAAAAIATSLAPTPTPPIQQQQQHSHHQQQPNQQGLLHSTNEDLIMNLIKTISPSITPQHDLSSSSDSGCRSNSFILNDEDSAIASIQSSSKSTVIKSLSSSSSSGEKKQQLSVDELTISEHLEFTCSNSSPAATEPDEDDEEEDEEEEEENEDEVEEDTEHNKSGEKSEQDNNNNNSNNEHDSTSVTSDCDTSDDASEIPTDAECLNELDLIDENFLNSECDYVDINRYNNVIEKDGTVTRKKLNNGIYRSMNQTLSLFIEPHDILKQMDYDEFNEYILFPNGFSPSPPTTTPAATSSTVDASSFLLIKNHVYII